MGGHRVHANGGVANQRKTAADKAARHGTDKWVAVALADQGHLAETLLQHLFGLASKLVVAEFGQFRGAG